MTDTLVDYKKEIADRYDGFATQVNTRRTPVMFDRLSFLMDLDAVSTIYPNFRWADLLAAGDGDFLHDCAGIQNYMNQKTGRLEGCFLPHFSGPVVEDAQQDEQADDLREMMMADVAEAKGYFESLQKADLPDYKASNYYLELAELAGFVALMIGYVHNEDITATQLGF